MPSPIYVAAGAYPDAGAPTKESFSLVRPTGGAPYVTLNKTGVPITQHHSHVYRVDIAPEGFRLTLTGFHGLNGVKAPKTFLLTASHQLFNGLAYAIKNLMELGEDPWNPQLRYQP